MKRREMDALAYSLCQFICSRNNDINGYWGIGVLCSAHLRDRRDQFSFQIIPGKMIRIYSCELSLSKVLTDKLVKFNLDSIVGRLSFTFDNRYPSGAYKYKCHVAIAVTQDGRTGMHLASTECWPHDSSRAKRRLQSPGAEGRDF
jgi:hypothetical protein